MNGRPCPALPTELGTHVTPRHHGAVTQTANRASWRSSFNMSLNRCERAQRPAQRGVCNSVHKVWPRAGLPPATEKAYSYALEAVVYNKGGDHTISLETVSCGQRELHTSGSRKKFMVAVEYSSGGGCNVACEDSKNKGPVGGLQRCRKLSSPSLTKCCAFDFWLGKKFGNTGQPRSAPWRLGAVRQPASASYFPA